MESKNIWVAASDGDLARVKELIEAGLSPTVADENSYTPLHAAASWGRAEVLKYLHSQGGDMNITDDDGDTPLFSVEDVETAKLIIDLGGDPQHKNEEGKIAAESLADEYPVVSNYLRKLTGEVQMLEDNTGNLNQEEDDEMDSKDPMNEMTRTLMDQVREIMKDAEAKGIDTNSVEVESKLREIVTKTVDHSVDLGRLLAITTTANTTQPNSSNRLESLDETDEINQLASSDQVDSNKKQKT